MKHTSSAAQIGRRNLSLQARNNPCMSLIPHGLCHSLNDMIWHLLCNAQGVQKDILPSTIWPAGIVIYYTVPDVVSLCLRLRLQLSPKIKQEQFFGCACRAISSRWLVPGDVIVLLPGKATCDMVLLQGNCLVEESVLSGEVLPCLKPEPTVAHSWIL